MQHTGTKYISVYDVETGSWEALRISIPTEEKPNQVLRILVPFLSVAKWFLLGMLLTFIFLTVLAAKDINNRANEIAAETTYERFIGEAKFYFKIGDQASNRRDHAIRVWVSNESTF